MLLWLYVLTLNTGHQDLQHNHWYEVWFLNQVSWLALIWRSSTQTLRSLRRSAMTHEGHAHNSALKSPNSLPVYGFENVTGLLKEAEHPSFVLMFCTTVAGGLWQPAGTSWTEERVPPPDISLCLSSFWNNGVNAAASNEGWRRGINWNKVSTMTRQKNPTDIMP